MSKLLLQFLSLFLLILTSCASSKKQNIDDYVFKKANEKKEYLASYDNALKLWKEPFIENYVPTPFGKAHVIVSGPKNAKALVLLHGMDASSTMWGPNIQDLTKNHRVFAIDFLMEPGKSEAPKEALTKEEILIWYNKIFDYYQLKNFDIVAASRGGWMATLLTTQNNASVDHLVLLSPAQTFENIDQPNKASSALFLKLFPSEKKLKKTLESFSFYPEKINPVFKKQFYLANKYSKSNSSLLQMQPFSDEELANIKCPVLVLIGDNDVINSEDGLKKAKEKIPHCKTEIIKNAGHFLSIDQTAIVDQKIMSFLKQ